LCEGDLLGACLYAECQASYEFDGVVELFLNAGCLAVTTFVEQMGRVEVTEEAVGDVVNGKARP